MASESTTPPNFPDDKPQNPVSELVKPIEGNGQDAKGEILKETSSKSVFVNSEPMREEQVQNAVKFLSHPKVRGSPVIYRRSFLERKGLTKEEIDEAFRRVPDPPPTVTSVQPATENQDGQLKSSANMQTQVPTQTSHPATAAPTSVVSTVATLSKYQFHWSHAVLAVGSLAASGAGSALFFKHAVVPRLKSWIRKVVEEEEEGDNSKPSLSEEAAAAAKAAAAAAADVAKASQEMLSSKNEEKYYFEAFRSLLDVQVEEMKSLSNAICKLEATSDITLSSNKQTEQHTQTASWNGPTNASWRTPLVDRNDSRGSGSLTSSKPWEVSQDSRPTSQLNGYSSEPLWQRKNVRISEIESENEPKTTSNGAVGVTNQQVPQRVWVPPQPPPVAMPEAAAAIRQPKPLIPKEQTSNDQISVCTSDDIDILQRVTEVSEVSESVDQLEINNESPSLESNEIQEQEISIEGN